MRERRRGLKTLEDLLSNTTKDGDCLRWKGSKNHKGYGRVYFQGKVRGAHRVTYELATGHDPEGLDVDHLCSVRDCVNPEHLEAVTHYENLMRSQNTIASIHASQITCRRGHECPPKKDGRRRCLICADAKGNCPECGKEMFARNIKRHVSNVHMKVGAK